MTTLSEFRASHPEAKALGMTLPALEVTVDGVSRLLSSSLTIAKYIAGAHKPELLGKTLWERALVDQWIQIIRLELQPIVRTVCY